MAFTPGVYLRMNPDQLAALRSIRQGEKALKLLTAWGCDRPASDWPEKGSAWDWDAWHHVIRCLAGEDGPEGGPYPFSLLYQEDDWITSFVPADKVPDVARALVDVEEAWFRERHEYALAHPERHHRSVSIEKAWLYLEHVRGIYRRAAEEGQAVVFFVDNNGSLRRLRG